MLEDILEAAEEFKPSLIALTAAAFALDALYPVIRGLVGRVGASTRRAEVAETLKAWDV